MLYTRKAEPPIQKYGLRITALPDGTFTIKAKQKAVNVKIEQPVTQPQAAGKYTSMNLSQ